MLKKPEATVGVRHGLGGGSDPLKKWYEKIPKNTMGSVEMRKSKKQEKTPVWSEEGWGPSSTKRQAANLLYVWSELADLIRLLMSLEEV